ncbi:hypothetical protein LQW54_010459 [Pestalotiopsis sp. IQ-011]
MGPEADGLSSDWVFSLESDHVCNDKRWFKTLVESPIIVKQRDVQLGTDLVRKAAGVGTVELPVKRSAHLQGRYAHDVLLLENVLYTPGFQFNIVGGSILRQNGWRYDADTPCKGQDSCIIGGRDLQVCYMRHISELPCIRLSGPPNGPVTAPSRLEADTVYTVNYVKWPEEERRRFELSRSKSANQQTPKSHAQPTVAVVEHVAADENSEKPYYTQDEKAWLKKHYGNEFKFLRTYGLSIYKENDRAEGRHLARSMMATDDEDDDLPDLIDPESAAETPSDPSEGKKKKNSRGGKKNHNAKTHQQVISCGLAGGGAATMDSVEVSRDVKVAGNLAAAEPVKVEQTIENTQPGMKKSKNSKKGKGKERSNPPAKVLTPEEEEVAAQSYLQSLLDNVAIKNAQDRHWAEAAPAQTTDTSQPAKHGKQKGNGKLISKENNEESDDMQYFGRPYPMVLGPITVSHHWM